MFYLSEYEIQVNEVYKSKIFHYSYVGKRLFGKELTELMNNYRYKLDKLYSAVYGDGSCRMPVAENDMSEILTKMSVENPYCVFTLHRSGEERGDYEVSFYFRGKETTKTILIEWPDVSISFIQDNNIGDCSDV